MTDADIVERVAYEIWNSGSHIVERCNTIQDTEWKHYIGEAKAAIKAISDNANEKEG